VKELHFDCSCDVSPGDEEPVIDCSILNVIQLKDEQHTVQISLTSVDISMFFVLIVAYYKFNQCAVIKAAINYIYRSNCN